jgi:hypothetical protein
MRRIESGDAFDGISESEADAKRREFQAERDERAKQRAMSKRHGVVSDLIAEAGNAENPAERRVAAARRVMRHATFSDRARAEAFCAAAGIEDDAE